MGTLFNELQKWLSSPHAKGKKKPNPKEWQKQFQIIPVVKEAEVDRPAVRTGRSAKNTTRADVISAVCDFQNNIQWEGNLDIVPYLVGQYALDVATMAKIEVQSLAYPTGKSPSLLPWALRFSPEQAYIDLGRLSLWDQWKVLWTRIGAHYFQDSEPFNAYENRWLK